MDLNKMVSKALKCVGILLIFLGVAYLLCYLLLGRWLCLTLQPSEIAVIFFIMMLGMAFIFPQLLQDRNKGLSTMRIVVFMMINVICLLLLKLGWDQPTLKAIGLDQWWMGIIAFVFGAKATQAYFESPLATLTPPQLPGPATTLYAPPQIAQLAIQQNQGKLKAQFNNILSLSDAVNDLQSGQSHVVAIYLSNGNVAGLPKTLTATLSDGSQQTIPTRIIQSLGTGSIQIAQINDITSDQNSINYTGCVCCLVKSTTNPLFLGAVTSGHILTDGLILDNGGIISPPLQGSEINKTPTGFWFFQTITSSQDLAIIEVPVSAKIDPQYQSFAAGYYEVTDADVNTKKKNVTIISKGKQTDAYIIDYNLAFDVPYATGSNYVNGIILLGSDKNTDNSVCLTQPGDSGSCVYHKASGKLIGMILGGNFKFSYVLTIEETLSNFNFKPV